MGGRIGCERVALLDANTHQSGQFDLCIHNSLEGLKDRAKNDSDINDLWDSIDWVVEFKGGSFGGPSGIDKIYKDFEKMYLSGKQCVFFYVYKVIGEKDYKRLVVDIIGQFKAAYKVMLEKIDLEKKEISKEYEKLKNRGAGRACTSWTFCIVLLNNNQKESRAYYKEEKPDNTELFPTLKKEGKFKRYITSDSEWSDYIIEKPGK